MPRGTGGGWRYGYGGERNNKLYEGLKNNQLTLPLYCAEASSVLDHIGRIIGREGGVVGKTYSDGGYVPYLYHLSPIILPMPIEASAEENDH